MTETTLIIARHGNTFGPNDIPTRVGARTDLPLVESGRAQGCMMGEYFRLNNISPDVVFASKLKRAFETAQMALAELGSDVGITTDEIFNEIDYGPDENMTEDAVIDRIGADAIRQWNESATVPAGWKVDPDAIIQNWLDFGTRCVADYAGQTILVVTSNGIARFAPHLTGDFEGFARDHDIKLSTGALCFFRHDGTAWSVTDWNVKPKKWLTEHRNPSAA